ncbi:hypothetical protein GCM10023196_017590 [Actinoallomurus vinaceus]|uniref:Uncharacterized protein n=1 Tax=Actinoallomurus vinaceus TaxID=1080074 RepID=A0ABP8U5R8_9ACTN
MGDPPLVPQRPAQMVDVALEGLGGGPRWVAAPQRIDQLVRRDDAVRPTEKGDEKRSELWRKINNTLINADLERPENAELDRLPHSCPSSQVNQSVRTNVNHF